MFPLICDYRIYFIDTLPLLSPRHQGPGAGAQGSPAQCQFPNPWKSPAEARLFGKVSQLATVGKSDKRLPLAENVWFLENPESASPGFNRIRSRIPRQIPSPPVASPHVHFKTALAALCTQTEAWP